MDNDRAVAGIDHADLDRVAGSVPADEHREPFIDVINEERVVECVDHVSVGDAVFASTGCDERSITVHKLPCIVNLGKVTCDAGLRIMGMSGLTREDLTETIGDFTVAVPCRVLVPEGGTRSAVAEASH